MINDRITTIIDINQLLSWERVNELELKPVYQRNKVWTYNAHSYLIDSILRNYPIPPIFIRDKINFSEKKTIHEVLDGQQRIRTILDYCNDKFVVKKSHNKEAAGKYFSDLSEIQQEQFLTYKIYVEKLFEKNDAIVFDIFARLNSNSVPLNPQELRNAKYVGEFKVAAYENALLFRDIFKTYGIFSDKKFSRMEDVEYISVLMIELTKGYVDVNKTLIDNYYRENNDVYNDSEYVSQILIKIASFMQLLLPKIKNFKSKFFSLVYLYDLIQYLISNIKNYSNFNLDDGYAAKLASAIDDLDSTIECIDDYDKNEPLYLNLIKYLDQHRNHSTNKTVKIERIEFLTYWLSERV